MRHSHAAILARQHAPRARRRGQSLRDRRGATLWCDSTEPVEVRLQPALSPVLVQAKARTTKPPTKIGHPRARRAYTLVEILVVIAVVLLLITMSVPLFNIILGNRSIEAAQNTISAMLAVARTEAVARQEPRGLAIFDDPATGRTRLAIVVPEPATNQPHNIDLSPSHDPAMLQPGIGARVMLNDGKFPPPNRLGDVSAVWVGVIWFDERGVVYSRPFTIQANSDLGRLVGTAYVSQASHYAMTLYDREAYVTESKNLTDATAAAAFLQEKAVWLVVGRYSGSLIRGE